MPIGLQMQEQLINLDHDKHQSMLKGAGIFGSQAMQPGESSRLRPPASMFDHQDTHPN